MRKINVLLIVIMFALSGWSQSPSNNPPRKSQNLNGKWWLVANPGVQAGFINGAADCLTWTAHKPGFNATPEQLTDKISKFYKTHPESANLTVVEVWEKVAPQPKTTKTPKTRGDNWTNAHWYLNADWWRQLSSTEREGYLTGYLWCMDNRVAPKMDSYSRSISFYQKKIDDYVESHPNAGNKSVALILRRYRDKVVPHHNSIRGNMAR